MRCKPLRFVRFFGDNPHPDKALLRSAIYFELVHTKQAHWPPDPAALTIVPLLAGDALSNPGTQTSSQIRKLRNIVVAVGRNLLLHLISYA